MTDEERLVMQRRMDLADAELVADGDPRAIVYLEEGQRLGGLVGPCWALACRSCRGDVHEGPCPVAPTTPTPRATKPGRRRRA